MKKLLLLSLTLLSLSFARAEDWLPQAIGPFLGLNNRDNSYAIPAANASDLLNVNVTPGGKSVYKRKGYAAAFTLAIATSAVHGVYTFFDSGGNTVDLYANDTRLNASVSGAQPTVLFSNGPNGATYQCTDSLGFGYCANSARTAINKTNGVTSSNLTGFVSTGTMLATAVTRLAMAGFSDRPSGIDFSADSDFNTWGSGSLGSSAAQFTINAPGSRVTHIVYAFGRLMWFKDASFGYILIGNQPFQADWVIKTVSYDVGTNDNTSVYREGILYFRGQDGHIYAFDGNNYERLSREISGTVSASQSRVANSWTQTTASDWNAGFIDVDIDSTTFSNSLAAKTSYYILNSSSEWQTNGTVTAGNTYYMDLDTVKGNIQTTFPDDFSTFRSTYNTSGNKKVWSIDNAPGASLNVFSNGSQLVLSCSGDASGVRTSSTTTSYAQSTTYYFRINSLIGNSSFEGVGEAPFLYFVVGKTTGTFGTGAGAPYFYVLIGTFSTPAQIFININSSSTVLATGSQGYTFPMDVCVNLSTSNYRVKVGTVTYTGTHTIPNFDPYVQFSIERGSTTIDSFAVAPQTFTYTSTSFNTGISTPIWGNFYDSVLGTGTVTHTSQVSSDGITFDSAVAMSSGVNVGSARKRFIRTASTYSSLISTVGVVALSNANQFLGAGSSGTFRSAVKNAPSISGWDVFTANVVSAGGSQSLFIRSSTNPITVNSSTPAWTAISPGAVPSISTGTYFQFRDDFNVITSTQSQILQDFTQNWFEGSATDKMYATYFDDRIWFSVASGTGATTNNKDLVWDMLNKTWTIYDIPSNGFLVRGNRLYFGSALAGLIHRFGDTENDNGAAINAYWKSKDFYGDTPFTQKEISNISVISESVANSTMTLTYVINGSSQTSYSYPQFNAYGNFILKNKNLPAGTNAFQFGAQFGNNAANQPFEVFAIQLGIRPKPWNVYP